MGTNDLADMKVEETTLRRKLESTRDLSERRQIRSLLRTLKEKREQRQKEVENDRANNNTPAVAPSSKPPATTQAFDNKDGGGGGRPGPQGYKPANDPKVRFANVEKPMERADSGSNILELRSRRRSLAKPPPSTSFLMNKLSNVMQREKAAHGAGPGARPKGVNAFRNKFENADANNNQRGPGNGSPVTKFGSVTRTQTSQTTTVEKSKGGVHFGSSVVEKSEEHEISHPNRNALRSRRRSVAKLHVPKHVGEKPSIPIQNGPDVGQQEVDKAKDNRFQRRLSRTRMTPKVDSSIGRFTPMGKFGAIKPNPFGTPAERLAYFKQEAEKDKAKNEEKPAPPPAAAKPAPKPAPKPVATPPPPQPQQQQNKENVTENGENKPIQKIARRSPPKKKPQLKRQMSVSQLVLQWCKEMTEEYENVNITNFSGSFTDGLAMAALIHKFNPELFDFKTLIPGDRERNFTTAFQAAEKVGVAVLLDVEDLVRMKKPEPRSVQVQVQMIFSKYRPKDLDTSQLTIA